MGIMSIVIKDQTGFSIELTADKTQWYMRLDDTIIGNTAGLTKEALLWYIEDLKKLAAQMEQSE